MTMTLTSPAPMLWLLAGSSAVGLIAWGLYQACHLNMVPGEPDVVVLLLPSSKGRDCPHPRSSVLSPLSRLRARWAWTQLARERGVTPSKLAAQIREDDEYDWVRGDRPAKGDIVRIWDRVVAWDEDCIDLTVLERWRDRSDKPADEVLDALSRHAPSPDRRDPLQAVVESLTKSGKEEKSNTDGEQGKEEENDETLRRFWKSIDRRPPRGCGAVSVEWYRENGLKIAKGGFEEAHAAINSIDFDDAEEEDEEDHVPTPAELEEEARVLKRGKEMFYRYGPPLLIAMLHAGLAGGFASPRIMTVLRATGYLVPPSKERRASKPKNADERLGFGIETVAQGVANEEKERRRHPMYFQPSSKSGEEGQVPSEAAAERTFKRLLETSQFVLDVMDSDDSLSTPSMTITRQQADAVDVLSRGGAGWLSATRVRFIHAMVRRRLTKGNLASSYDVSTAGVPINQEDLLATLCSFSTAPLWSLQRMGLNPTQQERQDYVALWRHVGYYMGIEPRLLRRCFRDVDSAERFFASVASHHFLPVTARKRMPAPAPLPPSVRRRQDVGQYLKGGMRGPALPLLYSIAERPPRGMSFGSHCAIARHLLGDALASAVELPGMTTRQYWAMRLQLFVLALPPLFARYYPRRAWGSALGHNAKEVLRRLTDFTMAGMVPGKGGKRTTYELRGEQKISWEDASHVHLDIAEGQRMRDDYFALMKEAGAVLALCLLTPLVATTYLALRSSTFYSTPL